MTLRVLIADDEPLARARIRRLLGSEKDVELVGECGDGVAAAEAVRKLRPDLVLLDINMPELDGFDVLSAIDGDAPPAIVFVTAYHEHAVRAFEAEALDYLLKPVSAARLHRTLQRARTQIRGTGLDRKIEAILKDLRPAHSALDRIAIRNKGTVTFVRVADITHIEAAGNYARVHGGKSSHLIRQTLADLETKLDAKHFVRIHRSTLVNVEYVRELRPWFGGDYIVVMTDGTELTLSRTHRARVSEILGV
jgi:two-component system LytT family response regulator